MVNVLSLLSLLFALTAQAAVLPSGVPQRTLCGGAIVLTETNAKSYISLTAYRIASSTNGAVNAYRDGVVYQVPTNKNFLVECVEWSTGTAAVNVFQLLSSTSTSTNAGYPNVPSGTVVYENNGTSLYGWAATTANVWYTKPFIYRFDEDTYPGIQAATSPITTVILHGREVDDL